MGVQILQQVFAILHLHLLQNKITDNKTEKAVLAFGHRRLSILDQSPAGHQPMSYANNRYWIVFNGEIYNYLEIKEELIKRGYHFLFK